ncbi:DUF3486 family protein [Desulfocurvibacter africanus]|uniref:Putative Mu-like prophage FluMu protein GP27 n=1 Tax=Desulfocurvibacter africanus subsp. africanus str. Walvis Bay TaxID=690850 RepID=F3YW07_DESAF|nr:DUF3486 family protein [Desulfocurvibacter africanus]EGJ49037.1 putative Mu-like prophage FluMu protein GP27 [Desulfocurvibacter africanus subsp. africanus str. Walvis Bay]
MARPSSIETLPQDILERLQELLRDPRVTQLDVTARINELLAAEGFPGRVSKSAVNRYAQRMEEVGAKLRQAREVAQMWIGKLGAAPQGQVGQLVNELLRTLAFDLSMTLQEGVLNADHAPEIAKMLKDMAIAMEKLEKAASENLKREEDIRRQERERVAQIVEETGKAQGLGEEQVSFWKEKFLGVR